MRQWVPLGAVMATYSPLSTKVASRNGCLQSPGVTLSGENLNRFSSELKLQYYCYSTCYRCFGSPVQRLSISKPTPVFWKVKSAEHADCSMLLTVGCTSCKAVTLRRSRYFRIFSRLFQGPGRLDELLWQRYIYQINLIQDIRVTVLVLWGKARCAPSQYRGCNWNADIPHLSTPSSFCL